MMKRFAIPLLSGTLLAAGLFCGRAAPPPSVTPAADSVFTSTREIRCLLALPDGTLWAGTGGGVLRWDKNGAWRRWTRREGLPAHEVRALTSGDDGSVVAALPQMSARWRDGRWEAERAGPASRTYADETCRTVWRGQAVVATPTALRIGERSVTLPPSHGTHVSALLPRGDALWAALFGDALWAWDGAVWRTVDNGLPPEAREITALAEAGRTLWVGTRRAGVWRGEGNRWTQHLPPDEPFDHNVQALAMHQGALFVSSLEDGLAVRTTRGWQHLFLGPLSSVAPRQMVAFQGALYLRHGSGKMDRSEDGKSWTRDLFSMLPRKQVFALAADGERLYVAQWGGWSEWDGTVWAHHLKLPELQGLPITALLPHGGRLWVGTQGRGLAEVERATGRVRWHDERHGLPDD